MPPISDILTGLGGRSATGVGVYQFNAMSGINVGDYVALTSTGDVVKADASNPLHHKQCIGVAVDSALYGGKIQVQVLKGSGAALGGKVATNPNHEFDPAPAVHVPLPSEIARTLFTCQGRGLTIAADHHRLDPKDITITTDTISINLRAGFTSALTSLRLCVNNKVWSWDFLLEVWTATPTIS